MRHFVVRPYDGVSELHFGATRESVEQVLGEPESADTRDGRLFLRYPGVQVIFGTEGAVTELSLFPGECTAELGGQPVLWVAGAGPALDLAYLLRLDPRPRIDVGFLVFFDLGLWITGFHDGDESQLSFGAFARGTFDSMLAAPEWSPAQGDAGRPTRACSFRAHAYSLVGSAARDVLVEVGPSQLKPSVRRTKT